MIARTAIISIFALSLSGCEPTISGPDHVKCTLFVSGETFTAEKRNMRVEGGFLHVIDDDGKVRAFRMIDSDSNEYVGKCDPIMIDTALKEGQ